MKGLFMNHITETNCEKTEEIIEFIKEAFNNFPLREEVDRRYFAYLMNDFGDLDIEDELKQYHAWTLDRSPNEKELNHHSRFRQWLKRALLMQKRENRY